MNDWWFMAQGSCLKARAKFFLAMSHEPWRMSLEPWTIKNRLIIKKIQHPKTYVFEHVFTFQNVDFSKMPSFQNRFTFQHATFQWCEVSNNFTLFELQITTFTIWKFPNVRMLVFKFPTFLSFHFQVFRMFRNHGARVYTMFNLWDSAVPHACFIV